MKDMQWQTVYVTGAAEQEKSTRYDVWVAPSGARFEYGPRVMRVIGTASTCDRVAFANHIRARVEAVQERPFLLAKKTPSVKVMGIRL